jgi:transposase-like protein
VHKTANALGSLSKSAQPAAKTALAEVWGAVDKEHAQTAVKAFARQYYGAKFPKAVAKVVEDEEVRRRGRRRPVESALPTCACA